MKTNHLLIECRTVVLAGFCATVILGASVAAFAADNVLPETGAENWRAVWADPSKADSVRLDAIYNHIWDELMDVDPDSAIFYARLQYDFAKSAGNKNYMQKALNSLGLVYSDKADQVTAIRYINECYSICEETGNKRGMAGALTNLGMCYSRQGSFVKAIDAYSRGLKIHEETKNQGGIFICLNGIGWLYLKQDNDEKALSYFQRARQMAESSGDKSALADTYNNLANVSQAQGDYVLAQTYLEKALKLFTSIGNKAGIAILTGNIGMNYVKIGDYAKARSYYLQALREHERAGDTGSMARISMNMGIVDNKEEKYAAAIKWCEKGLNEAVQAGNIDYEAQACECLYVAYKGMGQGAAALRYHERMIALEAEINKVAIGEKLQQMEFERVMLQDSINKAESARVLQQAHEKEVRRKNQSRNVALGIGGAVLMLAMGLYVRLRFVRRSRAALQVEKDRSDNLLLNILPEEIAAELKEKGKAEARNFDLVSILFTDFKGFTEQSAKLSASELVSEINHCFEAFDAIIEKFDIEKIKTIGDAYMAAGGLPVPTDVSIKNTALAALEMQKFISRRKAANDAAGKAAFEMRVGIHTGPVVAGIVGVKKFQYDIWGDTVNTAARIESAGEAGKVNISQATHALLQDDPDFVFENRGKIEAKGKGEIAMWFVSLKTEERQDG